MTGARKARTRDTQITWNIIRISYKHSWGVFFSHATRNSQKTDHPRLGGGLADSRRIFPAANGTDVRCVAQNHRVQTKRNQTDARFWPNRSMGGHLLLARRTYCRNYVVLAPECRF